MGKWRGIYSPKTTKSRCSICQKKHSSTGWVDTLLVVTRSSETTLFYHKAISPFLPHHLLLALLHRYIHLMPVMSSSVEGITPNAKPFAAKHALCMIKWCFVGSSDTERLDHSMLKTSSLDHHCNFALHLCIHFVYRRIIQHPSSYFHLSNSYQLSFVLSLDSCHLDCELDILNMI